jgi:TonB-linked SusC/RagA family outer membrane protein
MFRTRQISLSAGFLLLLLGLASPLQAQQGTITGRVTAADRALDGVQVYLPGTGRGTLTNSSGAFLIINVPAGEVTVRAERIGYQTGEQTVTVIAGGTAAVDFELTISVIGLDEIVVTGTTGRHLRRSQPAQVSVIDVVGTMELAPVTSVGEILQSRIPGVSITHGSGVSGSSQKIRIRGSSSISLSNEPLIFIDGIRANGMIESVNRPGEGSGSGTGTGGQATSRLNDLNPEDIQSIEVVKGPAAATLYGSDASAGVIQIITKRGSAGGFRQTVTAEYDAISHSNFDPPSNFGACAQSDIDAGASLCQGQAVGTVVSDNPLDRYNAFKTGSNVSLGWSGRGGTATGDFTYYLSLFASNEDGTLPASEYEKRSGRVNVTWSPHRMLTLNIGYSLMTTYSRQPDNNHSLYGMLTNALLGSPLTVGTEPNDGWLGPRQVDAIAAIRNEVGVVRHMPTLQLGFQPFDWLSNRLIVGGDYTANEKVRHIPRTDQNFYRSTHNPGLVRETRRSLQFVTLDYLTNATLRFGDASQWSTNGAVGVQVVDIRDDFLWGDGLGLATNSANVVSAAAESAGGQRFLRERSLGYIGQAEVGYQDRLFFQVGMRIDRNSSFGEEVGAVYLPKAGASWVVSDEPFFGDGLGFINTIRLRAAYGATGRAPPPGATLETLDPVPYATRTGNVEVGLGLLNPGKLELRPERGTEFEAGVDASFLDDRLGLELTYFNKVTKDLLLRRELPPSVGFREDPFDNVGEVHNRGIEVLLNAQVVTTPDFSWDVTLSASSLTNELVDLGDLPPFGQFERFVQGRPLSSFFSPKIRRIDVANNQVIVSDTLEFIGGKFPGHEGSISSTLTILGDFRLAAQLDWKGDYYMNNNQRRYREIQLVRAQAAFDPDFLSPEEQLRRFGPFVNESGQEVNKAEVREAWYEKADFLRFRELALVYSLPPQLAEQLGADRATITLSARNLALWTNYSGHSPEAISGPARDLGEGFQVYDFFNVPPARRYGIRVNLGF